ncbi:hypothetical protein I2I05_04975 [Hymenobacter sp. BT683]|uniref:DUF3592 domain-containing protein n=1 Tax=Hymenobacter jeongseonensis TaxID=2791027 RepID=A0ABS0IEG7_9BACT|nr:DUF3592 domain-containing protein [Hymenobacter jeongseonensis]MBF9236741.1 hypothetical protein [Hymenobacter jeongseonensis]
MKYKWAGLLAGSILVLFAALTARTMSSDFAGLLAYAFIFAGIPYTFYKTFPSRLGLLIAVSLPIALGMSWGRWVDFLIQKQLKKEGIATTGVVIAAWESRTRYGGKEKLFRASFRSQSGNHQTTSFGNRNNLQKGDSVIVRYAFSNPSIYHIEGLDN